MKRAGLVVLVALAARALVHGLQPHYLELTESLVVARHLNLGLGFVFEQYGTMVRAWKEPLWIALLALTQRLFGPGELPLLLLQWSAGAACAVVVMRIAERVLADSRLALVSGGLAAVNPFLVYYDTRYVHPLSFDVLLFLLLVQALLRAHQEAPGWAGARWAGLVCGLGLWQRGTLLAVAAGAWAASVSSVPRDQRRARLRLAAASLTLALLVIAPWLVRNWIVVGRPVLTTDFAHILWLGNHPGANGAYWDETRIRHYDRADESFRRRIQDVPELGQYDVFMSEALAFVSREPAAFLKLVGARLRGFFWFTPTAGLAYGAWQALLYALAYAALLVAGLAGLARLWRAGPSPRRQAASVLLGGVLGLAAVHAVTVVDLKHRVPFEMALCVFAPELIRPREREARS